MEKLPKLGTREAGLGLLAFWVIVTLAILLFVRISALGAYDQIYGTLSDFVLITAPTLIGIKAAAIGFDRHSRRKTESAEEPGDDEQPPDGPEEGKPE